MELLAVKNPLGVYFEDLFDAEDFMSATATQGTTAGFWKRMEYPLDSDNLFYNDDCLCSETHIDENDFMDPMNDDCCWNEYDDIYGKKARRIIIVGKFVDPLTFMSRATFDKMKNRGRKVNMSEFTIRQEKRLQKNLKNVAYKAYKKNQKARQKRLEKLMKIREALMIMPCKETKAPERMVA